MRASPATPCPDAEDLASFIDGHATPVERAAIVEHVADCESCREVVAAVLTQQGEAEAERGRTRPLTRRRAAGLAALAAAAALALTLSVQRMWPGRPAAIADDSPIAQLVAAVGSERRIEPRLTGGFRYGPLRTPTRSGTDTDNLQLLAIAARLQARVERDPTPDNLHAWGVSLLLLGRLDEAVTNLRDAASQDPQGAPPQTDLAAALLARGSQSRAAAEFHAALEAADTALERDPDSVEALFNRALALQHLNLYSAARAAWQLYLTKDSDAAWRKDAAERLAALANVPRSLRRELPGDVATDLSAFPEAAAGARDATLDGVAVLIEDTLLPEAAEAWLHGARDADRLGRLATLAARVSSLRHDAMLQVAAEQLRDAGPSTSRARDLATGLVAYGRMKTAFAALQMKEMSAHASACAETLARVESPLALWCAFYESAGAYYRGDVAASRMRAEALLRDTPEQFPLLRARLMHHLGGLAFVGGDYEGAATLTLPSIEPLERAGALSAAAAARQTIAAAYAAIGDMNAAWTHYAQAFANTADGAAGDSSSIRRHSLLISAGASAVREGRHHVAGDLFRIAVDEALASQNAVRICESYLSLARTDHALGRQAEAVADLDAAAQSLPNVADPLIATRLRADLQFARAEAALDSDPHAAVAAADEALRAYRGLDVRFRSSQLQLYRARAALQAGSPSDAEQSLRAGVEIVDAERRRLTSPELYSDFAARTWDLTRELVRLYLAENRAAEALDVLERARQPFQRMARPLVPSSADDDTLYLAFADLGGSLAVWSVSGSGVSAYRLDVTPRQIAAHLGQLATAARLGRADASQRILRRLHAEVIGPIESRGGLRGVTHLVVSADGAMQEVPFAALQASDTGRYLIEDMDVAFTRTWADYADSRTRVASRAARRAAALCDPINTDADLARLPASQLEANAVARAYADARVTCGAGATYEALVGGLGEARVVHFAGHALVDARDPWASRLIVSPSRQHPLGVVPIRTISAAMQRRELMPASEVVVLAACSTAAGDFLSRRSVVTLAAAFQDLGIRWVVATQRDIRDASAATLFSTFHELLASTDMDAATALRQAQLRMINSAVPPTEWGAVIVLAGAPTRLSN